MTSDLLFRDDARGGRPTVKDNFRKSEGEEIPTVLTWEVFRAKIWSIYVPVSDHSSPNHGRAPSGDDPPLG